MGYMTHDGRRLARVTVRKKRQKIKDDIDFRGARAGALPPKVREAVVDNRLPEEKGGISVKTTSHFGPGGESVPNRAIGPTIEKVVAKKSLEKSLPNKGKDMSKEAGKKVLADAAIKSMNTDSNTAEGAAMEAGMSTLASTGNPYMAAGAAAMGAIQGEQRRRARNTQLAAEGIEASAKAHAAGERHKQAAMSQMSRAFQGYFS